MALIKNKEQRPQIPLYVTLRAPGANKTLSSSYILSASSSLLLQSQVKFKVLSYARGSVLMHLSLIYKRLNPSVTFILPQATTVVYKR